MCALPPMLLAATANDLSPRVKAALAQVSFAPAYKIAWQSRRFWEQENNIYGGISWLANGPISLESGAVLANVWYPSDRLLSDQGVLIPATPRIPASSVRCRRWLPGSMLHAPRSKSCIPGGEAS